MVPFLSLKTKQGGTDMEIALILDRMATIARIIESDPKSPWNKERAREIQSLLEQMKR